ncbi:MAG: hypothetical protein M3P49_14230 [Actinomycetota bacterium]|nr:hypothetical protein [Actinomycetota bacterium]
MIAGLDAEAWARIVTASVALLAFGLSVYNFWERRRESKPSLRVTSGFGIVPRGGPYTLLIVANPGKVNVFLSQLYLELGEGRMFFPHLEGERPFPCKVEPGEAVTFFQETNPLHEKLRSLGYARERGFPLVAEDALENRYTHILKTDPSLIYPED